jgi:uncharacterized protein (DUF1501 family)
MPRRGRQPGDYKALVCVFLYGGNDHGNTLVPVDATPTMPQYAAIRGTLATPRSRAAGHRADARPGAARWLQSTRWRHSCRR